MGCSQLKVFLLNSNNDMTREWNKYFSSYADVEVVRDEFDRFMETHNVDCVVSPANSYGLMDGGYDLAITNYFGEELMKKAQQYI